MTIKVKYTGDYYKVYLKKGEIYNAEVVDDYWYSIYDEDDQESYLYDSRNFEVMSERCGH